MAKYKWPTDPPGKPPSHSISWTQHQNNTNAPGSQSANSQAFINTYNQAHPETPYGSPAFQALTNPPAAPPFDAELEARRSAATQRRTNLLSDQDVDLQQTSQEYGFSYNPASGAFGGFDPTNPFSQAALLMKARNERNQGENTSYAARGQLYSGSYEAAKKETGHAYDKGYDTLRRGFDDYVKNYLRRKRDIQSVPIEELANL